MHYLNCVSKHKDDLETYVDLLLPDSVHPYALPGQERVQEPLEQLPDLHAAASWGPHVSGRSYFLSRVGKDGLLPLGGGWRALNKPERLVVLSSIDDPGVALIAADLVPGLGDDDRPDYEIRKVAVGGPKDRAVRVYLGTSAMSRLALDRGEQVLMCLVAPFLVLTNPGWTQVWDYWEEQARRIGAPRTAGKAHS